MASAPAVLAFALAAAAVLAAAKAHGRQVRLVREKAGVREVEFGRDNGPFVNALWRRDRVRFWSAYPLLALAGVALWAFLAPFAWWTLALAAGPLAFAAAFFVAGLPHVPEAPEGTTAGTVAWWTLAAALGATSAALAWIEPAL